MMDTTVYLITVKRNDNKSVHYQSMVLNYGEAQNKMADLVESYDFGLFCHDRHLLDNGTTAILSERDSPNKGWIISMEKKRIIILDS